MPYQPSTPYPYLETIDASVDNTFTCVINPRDAITKYVLNIYNNDTGDNVLTVTEEDNSGYKRTYNGHGNTAVETIPYVLTTSQPNDWATNYTAYYTKSGNAYSHITGASAPTWEENTYYADPPIKLPFYGTANSDECLEIPIPANYIIDKTYGDYVLTTSQPSDWENHYTSYYTRSESTFTPVPSSPVPTWAANTYYSDKAYGDFVWNITLYNGSDFVTSCDYFFKVRDEAVVTLINRDTEQALVGTNNISSSQILLDCEYSQAQGIKPSYYCFNLYIGSEQVYTTGDIISSNIKFDYESLVSGNNYELEFIVGTEDRTEYRYSYMLNVSYEYRTPFVNPSAVADNDIGCVDVDFSNNVAIQGKYDTTKTAPSYSKYKETETGNPPVGGAYNAVNIPDGQAVYWDERTEDVPLNLNKTEQVMNWHGHEGFEGEILSKYDPSLPSNKRVVGHDIPNSIEHDLDASIYIDINDPAMPIGVSDNNIQAGFYYKYGSGNKTYISEFNKIASAIYKTDNSSIQDIEEDDIVIADDTLYILNDNDEVDDDDILLSNDTTNNYWWIIAMLSDTAFAKRSVAYSSTIVSE